ncbi:MAG: class I SAM-dependent methyltransferase [Dehalococcoidia bacterium]
MARVGVIRLEPSRMKALRARLGHDDTPRVYNDRFLVRELFWRRLDALLALSEAPSRERVLDFGGGNGVLTPTLSRLYREVVCVDLRTEMAEEIARSERLANVTARPGDIASLGLPDGHFDTIIAADVLEHIIDLDALAGQFKRLLKPGGQLLVSAPSENRFYELGRRIFGYTKPDDHYHAASFVEETLARHLPLAQRRYFPANVSLLAVFSLARFVKAEEASP